MTFSQEWDQRYRNPGNSSAWPWSDLIAYVMRHAGISGPSCRVLELGCGGGANIPFFRSIGVDYHGVEGSPTIVQRLWDSHPDLRAKIAAGDFTEQLPFAGDFDLVVDRSSLTHNSAAAIARCLRAVRARLAPGGRFIGIDWFSTADSEFERGNPADDPFTRAGFASGRFTGVGRVHFSNGAHLRELFEDFEILVLEHKVVEREIPERLRFASWNFVARVA